MPYSAEEYLHDSDRAALKALRSIPGFSALVRWFMSNWNEPQQQILNMSTRVRLGEDQLPEICGLLPPICEKLGIDVPDLYLELNRSPNAYTYGDAHPYIVLTSGLLETLPSELIPTVLAHECGHIACHHVLFNTMGRMVLSGAFAALGLTRYSGLLSIPLRVAFFYWMRCSELSADRAAVLVDGSPEKMQEVCFRLAGMNKDLNVGANMDAFMAQASEYREMVRGSNWNRTLEFMVLNGQSHPLMAVRALECAEWAASGKFSRLLHGIPAEIEPSEALPPTEAQDEKAAEEEKGSAFPEKLLPIFDIFRPEGDETEEKAEEKAEERLETGGGTEITVDGLPVRIPGSYYRNRSMPGDPPGSVHYGAHHETSVISLLLSPLDSGKALPFDYPEEVIRATREALEENQGLVEVAAGQTGAGRKYIYTIVKEAAEDGTTDYTLTMNVAYPDRTLSIHGFFDETRNCVSRDSSVWAMARRREDPEGWQGDPYDPSVREGFLKTRAEDRENDSLFPEHPLSLLRDFTETVIREN